MPAALVAVTTRTISLLTTDVKTKKLIGVSMEILEETLKSLNIAIKVLAKRSNAMWDTIIGDKDEIILSVECLSDGFNLFLPKASR